MIQALCGFALPRSRVRGQYHAQHFSLPQLPSAYVQEVLDQFPILFCFQSRFGLDSTYCRV